MAMSCRQQRPPAEDQSRGWRCGCRPAGDRLRDDGAPQLLIRYHFGNHLGSSSLEVDDAANVISYEEYLPYGSTSYQAVDKAINAAAKRYRFTGKERDEETGFSYHGARYLAP